MYCRAQNVQPIIVDAGTYLTKSSSFFKETEKRNTPDAFKFFTGISFTIINWIFIFHFSLLLKCITNLGPYITCVGLLVLLWWKNTTICLRFENATSYFCIKEKSNVHIRSINVISYEIMFAINNEVGTGLKVDWDVGSGWFVEFGVTGSSGR